MEFLQKRPKNEPLLESLEAAAIELVNSPNAVDRVLIVRRLARDIPALRVRWTGTHSELSLAPLTDAIAARTRTDPHVDVYPRVVTQATWGLIVSVLNMQSGVGDDNRQLVKRIKIGFASLGHGFSKRFKG